MIQDRSHNEQAEALKVDEAIEAIGENDLFSARCLLQEVMANAPEKYLYSYEEGDLLFIT